MPLLATHRPQKKAIPSQCSCSPHTRAVKLLLMKEIRVHANSNIDTAGLSPHHHQAQLLLETSNKELAGRGTLLEMVRSKEGRETAAAEGKIPVLPLYQVTLGKVTLPSLDHRLLLCKN